MATNAAEKSQKERTDTINEIESKYSVDELAANAALFKANPDIIRAALRMAGLNEATEKEATKIIKAFQKKEV